MCKWRSVFPFYWHLSSLISAADEAKHCLDWLTCWCFHQYPVYQMKVLIGIDKICHSYSSIIHPPCPLIANLPVLFLTLMLIMYTASMILHLDDHLSCFQNGRSFRTPRKNFKKSFKQTYFRKFVPMSSRKNWIWSIIQLRKMINSAMWWHD